MKTIVTLCFMVSLGLVVAQKSRGPCGCKPVFDFCANDYTTYHSICEYTCKHPSTPFQDWFILHQGPCLESETMDEPPIKPKKDPPTTKKPPTDYKWEPRTGSWYKMHTVEETWYTARDICFKEGGYLAIVNSKTESTILKEMFTTSTTNVYASLGFSKLDNQWKTLQGQSLKGAGFDTWSPGEPNNPTSELCGTMYKDGLHNDAPCKAKMYPFICEYTP